MKRRKFITSAATATGIAMVAPHLASAFQDGKKDTVITVIVNTKQINEQNKNQMTSLYDSRGGSSTNGNHKDFISLIDVDKSVFWEGQVADANQNPEDRVLVTKIRKKEVTGNKSLLKKDEYTGSESVEGKVRQNYEAGEEAYDIYFTVIRNGNATDYVIDPKLKIGT